MNDKPIDNKTKLKILETVLDSQDFRKAKKYQELLRYLTELSLKGGEVNESTIAFEFFGKKDAFDPSIDSTVRAYVSNLRKKIEHYYLTEGQNNEIQIVLPKGDYKVDFIPAEPPQTTQSHSLTQFSHVVLIPLSVALLCLVIWLATEKVNTDRQNSRYIKKNDAVWHDFFESSKKSLVVLGDYYFFSMPLDTGRHTYIRDININSNEDLEVFLKARPFYAKKISTTYHTYLDEHIPWSLAYIVPSLIHHGTDIELKLSSEVQLADLQRYNIIYVGPYKSLNLLSAVIREFNFKHSSERLDFFDRKSDKLFSYMWAANPETQARNDYTIVLKVAGGNDNTFLFFLSRHDFGNISTTKHFTDPTYLEELKKQITSNYFEALFEVKGIVRTDFEIKLLHVNELKTDFHIELN